MKDKSNKSKSFVYFQVHRIIYIYHPVNILAFSNTSNRQWLYCICYNHVFFSIFQLKLSLLHEIK